MGRVLPLKLAKLRIENYRNFRQPEIDLEADCTILIGENNSGKTNVLEALYACLRTNRVIRQGAFELSDFHLPNPQAFAGEAGPIRLTATFAEADPGSWDVELVALQRDKCLA
jgi:predicted ATP-dependent endonuclease of OLD family